MDVRLPTNWKSDIQFPNFMRIISINKIATNLARMLFAGLIFFEIFNYFKVFKFKVDFTWLGLIITSAAVWAGLEIIYRYFKKRGCAPHAGPYFAAAAAVYLDAMGDILHFYSRFARYDQIAHFFGSIAAGAIILYILKATNHCRVQKLGNFLMSFLTFTTVATLGVFYEIEEYTEDYFNFTNRLGDGRDTASDLLFNAMGALAVILVVNILIKLKPKK